MSLRLTLAAAAKYHGTRSALRKGKIMKNPRSFEALRGWQAALAVALACSQPFAQEARQGVAQLKDVHGNVLVSRESGLAAGGEALRLVEGTRVITTNLSEVTVVYDNGCEVKLKQNERFEIEVGKPCEALAALPQSILSTPAGATLAASAGTAAAFAAALPALGGAVAGLAVLQSLRQSQPVSPS
jgi:hypothetical protein